jgi:hypothetical protein
LHDLFQLEKGDNLLTTKGGGKERVGRMMMMHPTTVKKS